jgi:hypothetical protein
MTDRPANKLTRAEHGNRCPAPYRDAVGEHGWIEITMPHWPQRRFVCDYCPAVAVEPRLKPPRQ